MRDDALGMPVRVTFDHEPTDGMLMVPRQRLVWTLWATPLAARAELDAYLKTKSRAVDPVRMVMPLFNEAFRVRSQNVEARMAFVRSSWEMIRTSDSVQRKLLLRWLVGLRGVETS
jgi:hypothetical protein